MDTNVQSTIDYPHPNTYRSASEIAKDMAEIVRSIREMEDRLSLRDLLVETLYRSPTVPERDGIIKLQNALLDARDALSGIGALRQDLLLLEQELEVYRCHRV